MKVFTRDQIQRLMLLAAWIVMAVAMALPVESTAHTKARGLEILSDGFSSFFQTLLRGEWRAVMMPHAIFVLMPIGLFLASPLMFVIQRPALWVSIGGVLIVGAGVWSLGIADAAAADMVSRGTYLLPVALLLAGIALSLLSAANTSGVQSSSRRIKPGALEANTLNMPRLSIFTGAIVAWLTAIGVIQAWASGGAFLSSLAVTTLPVASVAAVLALSHVPGTVAAALPWARYLAAVAAAWVVFATLLTDEGMPLRNASFQALAPFFGFVSGYAATRLLAWTLEPPAIDHPDHQADHASN